MSKSYEDYLNAIEKEAVAEGLADFRLARDEFHESTGIFEDGEPWFELRMNMFSDWYLLDRRRTTGDRLTPVERYLSRHVRELSEPDRLQLEMLTVTLRSVFRIVRAVDSHILLEDLAAGGMWMTDCTLPLVGFRHEDIIDTRVVLFDSRPTFGRSTVLHPREAHEAVKGIIARAKKEGIPPRQLVDHLDMMRLKLDRYSNVKISHVYRYPGDAVF